MKALNSIVTTCLVVAMLFSIGMTTLAYNADVSEGPDFENVTPNQDRIEICELRKRNSKTFLIPDGSYQYVAYAENIHYQDASGELQEIDNSISVNKDVMMVYVPLARHVL